MEPLVIVLVVLVAVLALLVLGLLGSRPRRRAPVPGTEEASAEIEAHDIDQMIEARDELRLRTGREEIGNELAREALRRPPDR